MTPAPAEPLIQSESQLSLADRLQPVLLLGAIAAGLVLGRSVPGLAGSLAPMVSVGVFALICLVMLNVNPSNVASTFTRKRFLTAAIGLNFVVNPVIAWGLGAVFLGDQPDLRVGLILFLVTPCIGWYLVFTDLAGGDTELGVGLLGINVVLQVVLLPVYLAIFLGDSATIGLVTIVQSVGIYLVLPALLAAMIRRLWSRQGRIASEEQERLRVSTLKTAALALVIVSMFASQAEAIFDDLGAVRSLVVPMALFFGMAFAIALMVARRLALPHEQTALLVFTTASRNSEASLAIAATAFASPLVALTVALGPVIELPLLILMARILRSRQPGSEPSVSGSRDVLPGLRDRGQ